MDAKLIQQYGEEILSYRLRTARQKKRMRYEDFDKHLIQLSKEQGLLYLKRRNLGWEPLIPPVQKGWKRFFVLRDDVARGKQADFFQGILNKINSHDWSHRKDFMVKRRRFGRKKYVVKPQRTTEPEEAEFKRLEFTENEQRFFHTEFRTERWRSEPVKRYIFSESWRFVLKVKPNLIDKVRVRDGELDSQIAKVNNYLKRRNWEKRLGKIQHGYYKYRWRNSGDLEKYDEISYYKNKSLHQIMNMLKED